MINSTLGFWLLGSFPTKIFFSTAVVGYTAYFFLRTILLFKRLATIAGYFWKVPSQWIHLTRGSGVANEPNGG